MHTKTKEFQLPSLFSFCSSTSTLHISSLPTSVTTFTSQKPFFCCLNCFLSSLHYYSSVAITI
ncbi:hypothetical protein Hanom_Chr09g00868111 [Helianthus anomalus]